MPKTIKPDSPLDWEDIGDSLEEGKCILFIGPYAYKNAKGEVIEKALYQYLEKEQMLDRYIKSYYEADNFFYFKKPAYRNRVLKKIKEFYKTDFQPPKLLLEKIAQIPFSLIVSLTPDKYLHQVFESPQFNFPYHQDSYDKSATIPVKYYKPNKDKPLIYNLLGDLEKDETLIMTHDDLFGYLKSLFAENKMHKDLQDQLIQAETYIFLGLPMDKWYTQLLMRLLKLENKGTMELERIASSHGDIAIQTLYQDQFHFNLIEYNVEQFVDQLYNKCKDSNLLKLPQTFKPTPILDIEAIKEEIRKGKPEKAMSILRAYFDRTAPKYNDLAQELIQLEAEFSRLKEQRIENIVEEYSVKIAQFIKQLVAFIQKVEKRMNQNK